MMDFYHPRKNQQRPVPHILGLTASPVMNSDVDSLQKVEGTLDAICRSPQRQRAELLLNVNCPALIKLQYQGVEPSYNSTAPAMPKSLRSLWHMFRSLDISDDPHILRLEKQQDDRSQRELKKALEKQKTPSTEQLSGLCTTASTIFQQLGFWAAEFFVSHLISKFVQLVDADSDALGSWASDDKLYLRHLLGNLDIDTSRLDGRLDETGLSDKVVKLVDFLSQQDATALGIIFVRERATAGVLAYILAHHSQTRNLFRVGSMVGLSANPQRQKLVDLIGSGNPLEDLKDFREGTINYLVATSVLEEGIDVPKCNIVVCFDEPANLKSFVQRRGRARNQKSKLVMMLEDVESKRLAVWQVLEEQMKRVYEDDLRELEQYRAIERCEDTPGYEFRSPLGGLLTVDNALSHLYHFCANLPAHQYANTTPDFICTREGDLTKARVILPLSVNKDIREAESARGWKSEHNAVKDAAFHSYMKLYEAGLINDHLMPSVTGDTLRKHLEAEIETRPSVMTIHEQMSPWLEVAKNWPSFAPSEPLDLLWSTEVSIFDENERKLSQATIILPIEFPRIPDITVYWDEQTKLRIRFGAVSQATGGNNVSLELARRATQDLLDAGFGSRFQVPHGDFITLFLLPMASDSTMAARYLEPVTSRSQLDEASKNHRIIRSTVYSNTAATYREWLDHKPSSMLVKHLYRGYDEVEDDVPHLSLTRVSRRTDFLHEIPSSNTPPSEKPYSYVAPVTSCTIESLTFSQLQLSRLIPSIEHRLGVYLLASHLNTTILSPLHFPNLDLLVTAISANSACEQGNYQRLEFLGDSLLKFCICVQLTAIYPLYTESYLSKARDHFVSNARLAYTAIELGLDRYILLKTFTGVKWRPLYANDVLSQPKDKKREISSKILADVVEALIGASYVAGGIPQALQCLKIFLPQLEWLPLSERRETLFNAAPASLPLPSTLEPLEFLLGYNFERPSLLVEALTHSSCPSGHGSLERLEFLGDTVLDNIIVSTINTAEIELTVPEMHLLRTALVNADFLAFTCMSFSISQDSGRVVSEGRGESMCFKGVTEFVDMPLWKFMRHDSAEIADVERETQRSFLELRESIKAAIEEGDEYPWYLLARLQAKKFYSDVVESVLGALWVDSGSSETCKELLEKMGVLRYARRLLELLRGAKERGIADRAALLRHPREAMGILAGTKTVKYVIGVGVYGSEFSGGQASGGDVAMPDAPDASTEGTRAFTCQVFVGEEEIVKVYGGLSKEEVKTKAADAAVRLLKERLTVDGNKPQTVECDGLNVMDVDVMDVDIEVGESRTRDDTVGL